MRVTPGVSTGAAARDGIGAGETVGWAFLIVDEGERPDWQARLVAGYHVTSRILATLPDHLLAETVQGRVNTVDEAEELGGYGRIQAGGSFSPVN